MRRAVAKSKIKTRSRRLDPDQEPSPPPVPIPSTAAVGKGKEAAANLCDDSDSEIIITNVKQTPAEIIQASSDDSDSDEYVRELKRKAREKKRNQLLDAKANSTTPDPSRPSSSSQQLGSGVNNPERPNVPTRNTETPPPLEDDPVCRILLTSPIPGTNPIIVERRASQRLKEVRDYWCKRQGFDEAFSRTVFLTWRLHKLFDISTCKSLADKASGTLSKSKDRVEFDNDGIFSQIPTSNTPLSPSATNPFLEKSKGRITVEAMTEEHFVKAKQLARQKETNDNHTSRPGSEPPFINNSNPNTSSYPNINDPTTQPAPPTQPEPEVRILLRARPPLVPLKLKVRPSTSIWKIISAFKDQRIKSEIQEGNLSPETQVSLTFDGDVLDPDSIVGDTEIEDTDTVDVVVK
ncbi:hypothetical protein UCRPC4_g00195 [Phaeomoniella chlamydospora]|uniref:Ubiquitin-like domain-containing protein n=1 Tax=Phaeomoniella chlamydospora TaxID=158046 RepID=A0A0G2F416_PHACM|nr:hypothetical protein UCRPC4_g00195 [Phaeomoniella chlamydospora]